MASASDTDVWFDLHCHVLPGMDDGCKTCEESAGVLLESRRQGICGIAATPHYYPVESVGRFLDRRQAAYERLLGHIEANGLTVPALCLGAEVAYRNGISREERLEQLCYGQSDYLLLEMPFSKWTPGVLREIREIRLVRGLVPVIAHLERYMGYQDRKTLAELFELNIPIQMNAEFYLGRWTRRKAGRMIRQDTVQVLGSDCHNMDRRPPTIGPAVGKMREDGLGASVDRLCRNNREIFTSAMKGNT